MADRKFGICTHYRQNEVAYAAIQLADKAISAGIPADIYSADTIEPGTCPRWDHKVISSKSTATFFKWILNVTHLLWTSPPPAEDIEWANSRGIETWILASWDMLTPKNRDALKVTSKIITPYMCVTKAIQDKWKISTKVATRRLKFSEFMWDVPLPISTKKTLVSPPKIKLLFPLFDSQEERVDDGILLVVNTVLENVENAEITLAVNKKCSIVSPSVFVNLKNTYGDRVNIIKNPTHKQRYSLYASNDLTVWGATYEGLASVGLSSLCMGTPVISWDIDPQTEYLHDDMNSVLVPCDIDENWLGVPIVIPNWEVFASRLLGLLQSPNKLAKLRDNSSFDLANRKQDFNYGWQALWGH